MRHSLRTSKQGFDSLLVESIDVDLDDEERALVATLRSSCVDETSEYVKVRGRSSEEDPAELTSIFK